MLVERLKIFFLKQVIIYKPFRKTLKFHSYPKKFYRNEMKTNSIYILEDKHNLCIIMKLFLNLERNKA